MNAFDQQDLKRRAHNAYLSEDNPGCLLVMVLVMIIMVIALVR